MLFWLHVKFVVVVIVACWVAWKAYYWFRYDCFINCDENEFEADAHTPAPFKEDK